jgi:hypothetical protein
VLVSHGSSLQQHSTSVERRSPEWSLRKYSRRATLTLMLVQEYKGKSHVRIDYHRRV